MRVPGRVFASRGAHRQGAERPGARSGRQRRAPAGHRRRVVRDARHPLGLRVPDRRRRARRTSTTAAWSRRAAWASTSRAACGSSAATSTSTDARERLEDLVASSRAHPARRRRQGADAAVARRDGRRARATACRSRSRGLRLAGGRRGLRGLRCARRMPIPRRSPTRRRSAVRRSSARWEPGNHFVEVQYVDEIVDADGRRGLRPVTRARSSR